MSCQNGFPQELLNQPAAARLSYFKAFTMAHPSLNSAMRSQPLNLHLRQERDQRMGTHFRDGWQIKLDERFPLLRRQLELIGVGRSIRYVLCAQRRIVSETMECRG